MVSESRRQFYIKQISRLEDELAAVEVDLESVLEERQRGKLEKQAENILDRIDKYSDQLERVEVTSNNQIVKENSLENILYTIDFDEAREIAAYIRNELSREGGAALFLMQKSKMQMGNYCVEEVFKIILADQLRLGKAHGHKRYPVSLDSQISQCNQSEFLVRFSSYFGVDDSCDFEEINKQLRKNIVTSLSEDMTVFVEVKGVDRLLKKDGFFVWLLEHFWKTLVNDIKAAPKARKSRFIMVLVADGETPDQCPSDYFCKYTDFDCYKMLELPLSNWTVKDIFDWMKPLRGLSKRMKGYSDQEIYLYAEELHEYSKGIPESICSSLREEFL